MLIRQQLIEKSAQYRKAPTPTESIAAVKLKEAGIKFQFQKVIGFYIVDFFIPEKALIIEIDGHSHEGRERYDSRRDKFLNQCGFRIKRIQAQGAYRAGEIANGVLNIQNHIAFNTKALKLADKLRTEAETKHMEIFDPVELLIAKYKNSKHYKTAWMSK